MEEAQPIWILVSAFSVPGLSLELCYSSVLCFQAT